jgi:predicted nucleic acid-binding protein
VTLYLDTSSLVKLYVSETDSDTVGNLVDAADVVATSAIAYPEARAALARRRREKVLAPAAFQRAKRALDEDWSSYLTLEVSASLCRAAGDIAERYRLRGFDSVHLASFLDIARLAGTSAVQFSSADDRLNRAAQQALRALARAHT